MQVSDSSTLNLKKTQEIRNMALDRNSIPQVISSEELVAEILDTNNKYQSLLDFAHNVGNSYTSNGKVARISQPKETAVAVNEGDALSADSDIKYALVNFSNYKFGNISQMSREWYEDTFADARANLASQVVRSHQRASDSAALSVLGGSVDIAEKSVADAASLALGDLIDACSSLSWHGMLPSVYCSAQQYHQLKGLEIASASLSPAGEVLGLTWIPCDLPSASASGDVVCYVGDISRELCVSDKGLRVAIDSESSVANALNGMQNIVSYHRFSLGLWGDGSSLSKIVLA